MLPMPQCPAFLCQRALQRDKTNTVCMSNMEWQKKSAQEKNKFPCLKLSDSTQLQVKRKKREQGLSCLYQFSSMSEENQSTVQISVVDTTEEHLTEEHWDSRCLQ